MNRFCLPFDEVKKCKFFDCEILAELNTEENAESEVKFVKHEFGIFNLVIYFEFSLSEFFYRLRKCF